MEGIMKKLSRGQSATFSDRDCKKLLEYIDSLKQSAKDGVYYRGGAAPFGGGTAGYFARNNGECDKGYDGSAAQGVQNRL